MASKDRFVTTTDGGGSAGGGIEALRPGEDMLGTLMAGDNVAKVVIQSPTHGEIKLSVLGDDLAERAVTGGPSPGVAAVREFLATIG